ncbi:XopAW family type III secretion system calcium-binding effector [Chitinolyticbacter meiyuanensis]|uniref:XopAW family type III secretion system calcium-binding effector n=1 Tax=Chitinolyticbacter meiyuanensis TaxID=682798 RepID=UPI001652363D|nr:XopAW family type III secretion system calcium-binding effector [Chitinolyticbacter meiyuanensis]
MISGISSSSSWSTAAYSGMTRPSPQDRFKALDADADGGLTLDEFSVGKPDDVSTEQRAALFEQLDANGDGVIDSDENDAAIKQMESQFQQAALQFRSQPPSLSEMLSGLDEDDDGAISLSEFQAGGPKDADSTQSEAFFNALDADGDGVLSSDEVAQADEQAPAPPTQQADAEALIQKLIAQLGTRYGSSDDSTSSLLDTLFA